MNTYKATIEFIYAPDTINVLNVEEITEAAANYLAVHVNDFVDFGVGEFELIEVYAKSKRPLVTFLVEMGTMWPLQLNKISEKFEDMGEE